MTNLKCPEGHSLIECTDYYDYKTLHPHPMKFCNICNRPYFEIDCIKENQLSNKNGSTEPSREKQSNESWIDINHLCPDLGDIIDYKCGESVYRGIKFNFEYHDRWNDLPKHINIKWKLADQIADGDKKLIELCQCDNPLGTAIRCSVHHDQYCGDGIGCKMEHYCAYCESAIDAEKLTIKKAKIDNKPEKVDKKSEKICQLNCVCDKEKGFTCLHHAQKDRYQSKCDDCESILELAPGIDYFCPNKKCPRRGFKALYSQFANQERPEINEKTQPLDDIEQLKCNCLDKVIEAIESLLKDPLLEIANRSAIFYALKEKLKEFKDKS